MNDCLVAGYIYQETKSLAGPIIMHNVLASYRLAKKKSI